MECSHEIRDLEQEIREIVENCIPNGSIVYWVRGKHVQEGRVCYSKDWNRIRCVNTKTGKASDHAHYMLHHTADEALATIGE